MRYWLFCSWRTLHNNETHFGVTQCRRCRRVWRRVSPTITEWSWKCPKCGLLMSRDAVTDHRDNHNENQATTWIVIAVATIALLIAIWWLTH